MRALNERQRVCVHVRMKPVPANQGASKNREQPSKRTQSPPLFSRHSFSQVPHISSSTPLLTHGHAHTHLLSYTVGPQVDPREPVRVGQAACDAERPHVAELVVRQPEASKVPVVIQEAL